MQHTSVYLPFLEATLRPSAIRRFPPGTLMVMITMMTVMMTMMMIEDKELCLTFLSSDGFLDSGLAWS